MSGASPALDPIKRLRNIGISAHIDSGKTTLTERVLYYSGRIHDIHEVKGKDGVGATMDSMDLEREKGITIQSAATRVDWGDYNINIIDTPGHVDFTIEVERALRVLDGAVMIVCSVGGVQSQTMTVDRQMKRYKVPRVVFINKCDRQGADPWRCMEQVRAKLGLNVASLQVPIGLEDFLRGVVDLVEMKGYEFDGQRGELMVEVPIPDELKEEVEERRAMLIEAVAEVDDELAEHVVMCEDEPIPVDMLKRAIRRATLAHRFSPLLVGSAFKNKGVQLLLNAIVDYLPSPDEVANEGVDLDNDEAPLSIACSADEPFVGLAFKLEENRFGQLTYVRVYRGSLRKGAPIANTRTGARIAKTPRLIRMHSNQMEDIQQADAGDICAIFGVECNSGDTFTSGANVAMSSMHVPEPVISFAVKPGNNKQSAAFSKALARFQREDPTFRVGVDLESNETIISGMGELHLQIYIERMKREYDVDIVSTPPRVAYRETIRSRVNIDHTHRKQSGGAGQYARIIGYLEPLEINSDELETEFVDETIGGTIPPEYMPACEKGFHEIVAKGPLTGHHIQWVRMVVTDGAYHAVDSSDLAFRIATVNAFRDAFKDADPALLEPVMTVEVSCPAEHQPVVIGGLNRRKGLIVESDTVNEWTTIIAEVSLASMFGYSTDLRSCTQGKGEYAMAFTRMAEVPRDQQRLLEQRYQDDLKQKEGKY
jgi:elongation factor G